MCRRLTRTLICVLIAIGVGIYLCLPRAPRFTEEQFDRILVGMTLAEVETVLGCPPGDFSQTDYLGIFASVALRDRFPEDDPHHDWAADTPDPWFTDGLGNSRRHLMGIRVWFRDGRVIDKDHSRFTYTPPTLVERLRAWMGW